MRNREPKTIEHVLKHKGIEYKIGETFMPYGNGACASTKFKTNWHDPEGGFIINRMVSIQTPGDHEIYMYEIWDAEDGWYYYMANHLVYYNENGYHDKIIYDVPMESDNPITALKEFAEIVEPHLD